jgi:hypothetical protein
MVNIMELGADALRELLAQAELAKTRLAGLEAAAETEAVLARKITVGKSSMTVSAALERVAAIVDAVEAALPEGKTLDRTVFAIVESRKRSTNSPVVKGRRWSTLARRLAAEGVTRVYFPDPSSGKGSRLGVEFAHDLAEDVEAIFRYDGKLLTASEVGKAITGWGGFNGWSQCSIKLGDRDKVNVAEYYDS